MIDIFSRYLWTRPLKSKKPSDIIQSLQSAWKEGRKPHHIRTDKGGEFLNRNVSKLMKSK